MTSLPQAPGFLVTPLSGMTHDWHRKGSFAGGISALCSSVPFQVGKGEQDPFFSFFFFFSVSFFSPSFVGCR